MIILTCILQIILHSGILFSVHTCKQINTPKIGKILKVEINLSVLKFDLSKLGFKVGVFSIEIKRKFDNLTKVFCSVVNQTFLDFGIPSRV